METWPTPLSGSSVPSSVTLIGSDSCIIIIICTLPELLSHIRLLPRSEAPGLTSCSLVTCSHRPRKDLYSSPVAFRATHLGRCHARLPSAVVRRSIQQVKYFADAPRHRAPKLYNRAPEKDQNQSINLSIYLFCLHILNTSPIISIPHYTMHLLQTLHQKLGSNEHKHEQSKNGATTTVMSRTDTNQSSVKPEYVLSLPN